jgi:hypothetical protein
MKVVTHMPVVQKEPNSITFCEKKKEKTTAHHMFQVVELSHINASPVMKHINQY